MEPLTADTFFPKLMTLSKQNLPSGLMLRPEGIVREQKGAEQFCPWESSSISAVNDLLKQIPRFFQKHDPTLEGKKPHWNATSSYSSKHFLSNMLRAEEAPGSHYCMNGEFIFAMWLLNYKMKPIKRITLKGRVPLDATFNCSRRDLSKHLCACGIQYTKASKKQHERTQRHQMIMHAKHVNDTDTEFGEYLDEELERII